jgi:membrane-associated phospholipid phosphatase
MPDTATRVLPVRVAVLVTTWIALVGILVGAGELVVHSSTVQGFDNRVTSFVVAHRNPRLDAAMKVVTWLGSWVALLTVAAIILVLVLRRRLPLGFLLVSLAAWAGSQGATTLTKRIVQRPRPPEHLRLVSAHGWSWPSGHAATATLVFTVMLTVVWVLTPVVGLRILAFVGAFAAIAAVAFSRVQLGIHWTTDVIASVVFVWSWLLVAGSLFAPTVVSRPDRTGVG